MEHFIYYEIEGYLPSSFVQVRLGNVTKFANREKAIQVLKRVLKEWRASDSFAVHGELVHECEYEDRILHDYRHQFVFKKKRSGYFYDQTFKVRKHFIVYEK